MARHVAQDKAKECACFVDSLLAAIEHFRLKERDLTQSFPRHHDSVLIAVAQRSQAPVLQFDHAIGNRVGQGNSPLGKSYRDTRNPLRLGAGI